MTPCRAPPFPRTAEYRMIGTVFRSQGKSMLSPDVLVLQLSYALLVLAVLAPTMGALRVLVAVAALIGLVRALVWTGDVSTMLWMGLLLLACLLLLARTFFENRKVRFTPD